MASGGSHPLSSPAGRRGCRTAPRHNLGADGEPSIYGKVTADPWDDDNDQKTPALQDSNSTPLDITMNPTPTDKDTSLKSIEADLDRSIEEFDKNKEAEERAKAAEQLENSEDDPAPLSDYKRAEAIKKGAI